MKKLLALLLAAAMLLTFVACASKPAETQTPAETPIPKVEEKPTRKPSRVYLTFYGAPDKNAPDILDALKQDGRTAAFFLPADTAEWTDDTVRRIAAEGHTAALLLEADAAALQSAIAGFRQAAEQLAAAGMQMSAMHALLDECMLEKQREKE